MPVTYTREASQLETGTATRLPSASIVVESSQDFRSGPGISMPMDAGTSHTANGIIITSSYSQDAGLAGPGHGTPGVAISASSSGFISNQTFRASCDPSLTPTSCINNEAYDSCLNSTGGNSCINSKTDISKIFGSTSYGEIMPPTVRTLLFSLTSLFNILFKSFFKPWDPLSFQMYGLIQKLVFVNFKIKFCNTFLHVQD